MLRIPSPLDPDLETLVHHVIGCCVRVHTELGPGLPERAYERAVCWELESASLPYACETTVAVKYRERPLCVQRVDLIVSGRLVLELKCVDRLLPVHHAQVRTYMRLARVRIGLLINFNVPVLPEGIRRIIV
jgi:GxxExxY protein